MILRRGPIDVHAHWLPQHLFGLAPGSPLPPLRDHQGELHLGDLPLSIRTDAMSDVARVLADTDAAGLGARVLSAPPFAFPVAEADGVDEFVGTFNDDLDKVCRDSGGRLIGLGLVSLHDPAAARKQLEALAGTEAIRGIAVPPLLGATSFDVAPMREILGSAADLGLAVLVHPMQLPRPEWSSHYLANLIGNPVESATAAAALTLGGVLEEHPALRICLVHGGGCAPALVGRWEHGWQQRADVRGNGTRPPREMFAALWFDTLTHDVPTLNLLRAQADEGRLMCGSDYPFDMGTLDPLQLPHAAGIDDAALEANARAFLGLDTGEDHE
ncbi:amidohydrolase family protein [Mycolicibacterium psychrotolerans]|uniref:2-hydroxy-3-carboxy-6-oxo-7-methylocta-2,4-dienoa te decarboxylase n=1 Tax=Mycolicibacterium psychrotolerans TaxID=216929 RepID=A0A7I7M636_9MYCO|nr:amidohydrolase family protein [Mycolicibacterium psychrotolerans]BBX67655.1 2-hydroxy-3-carboxy-6-oxo-7-methylocta-2,4-dienoa te decarboxylase [Mycolicibacterium psychrotolerans]